MSIKSDILRGHTDTIILRRLLNQDSYGYDINKNIQVLTLGNYELKEATLYTSFRRLEKEGLVESYWGDENVGARRRYYKITEKGKDEYKRLIDEWEESKKLIEVLIK